METDVLKQEVLLVIRAFHQREFCDRNESEDFRPNSYADKLEEACWNGLLDELPEGVIKKTSSGKRLCLWHMQQTRSFLEIELCNCRQTDEKHLSINPYISLPFVAQN